jgi:phosphoribosylanthranilate isomerase
MLEQFFSPKPSLKICGVTTLDDATRLTDLRVSALGINFWPQSKRYCSPKDASTFASHLAGDILRVGVFVNNSRPLAADLIDECLIDVVQLHGNETLEDIHFFLDQNIPVIRAVSALHLPDYELPKKNFALLIDTPAGSDYGGTGKTFDWSLAHDFAKSNPQIPLILAGGITPDNAAAAIQAVLPAALDVASGAELSPGLKDFDKVRAILASLS